MRDIVPSARYSPFVTYCVNGKPCSSLFIESTDSMIHCTFVFVLIIINSYICNGINNLVL